MQETTGQECKELDLWEQEYETVGENQGYFTPLSRLDSTTSVSVHRTISTWR